MRSPIYTLSLLALFASSSLADEPASTLPSSQPVSTMPSSQPTSLATQPSTQPESTLATTEPYLPPAYLPKKQRTFDRKIRNATGLSVNLLGLQNSLEASWSRPLFQSENPLLKNAHIAFGVADSLTPATNRIAAWVEFAPLSILEIRAGTDSTNYFGTFSALLNFDSFDENYSEDAIKAKRDAGENVQGFAFRRYVKPTLQLQIGHIVAALETNFEYWEIADNAVSNFFYEPERDTLLKASGTNVTTTNAVLLYEKKNKADENKKFYAGLIHESLSVEGAPQNQRQTLGLLYVNVLGKQWFGLKSPSLVLRVQHYIKDREDLGKVGEFGAATQFRFYFDD